MNDEGDRIDFRRLDPTRDADRLDRAVASIMAAAESELADRRYRRNTLGQVAGWRRPLLAAAAVTAVLAVGTLATVDVDGGATDSTEGIAEAIGMSEQIASWVRSEGEPGPAELLLTLEEYR